MVRAGCGKTVILSPKAAIGELARVMGSEIHCAVFNPTPTLPP
jgi:hypothetical protein